MADIGRRAVAGPDEAELRLVSRTLPDGAVQTDISAPAIHCGGCIGKIEDALGGLEGIESARVNLSGKRVTLVWRNPAAVGRALGALEKLGYKGHLLDLTAPTADTEFWRLVKALAVAAFASMNVMTLSVGVWSGADGTMRDLLHGISGLIALPALLYSGRVFYLSAFAALRRGTTNMDVPITIGIALAFLLSVFDTLNSAHHAYFDAVTSLVFFLLIGRTLDHMMRERARTTVRGLERLVARGAVVRAASGQTQYRPLAEITPDETLLIAAGERIPLDCEVSEGHSDIDVSLVNGEAVPLVAAPGTLLRAGTLNLTGPLTVVAKAAARDSFLAEMIRMMDAADAGRGRYRRVADRLSRYYAPIVHLAAFLSFAGWMVVTGDFHHSITIAIAVLIITCPCALGLAVPMVHVVAAQRLFARGIMLRDGAALERLAEIDTVVFDKTGTLTTGELVLDPDLDIDPQHLIVAAALAAHSLHPVARAISRAAAARDLQIRKAEEISESAGFGVEGRVDGVYYRLGRRAWATGDADAPQVTVLAADGRILAQFGFGDELRKDARKAIATLETAGLDLEVLSGDSEKNVSALAADLGVERAFSEQDPGEKLARLATLKAEGHKVLMIGDGLNDGPAIALADVAMTPSNAADVGRARAGLVFLHESLLAVPEAIGIARGAAVLVRQNFVISILYNVIALPIAVLGHVTPLVAALAMSISSVIVVANAMRLGGAPAK
ncbi:heavy metal translocating P-type ATPase [Pelagibacterium limicola]|uniref:heavy metal translocating P-type ATPase n=1 Tax=Pelagibacterium limicola TaxID=2791022 RepID=UPI001FE2688C|nr:heavy metal translocating P-type ATPase [Pelagibacterium limicola]